MHISLDGGDSFPHEQFLWPHHSGGYAVVDMVEPNIIGVLFERAMPGTCVGTNMTLARVDARDVTKER